MGNDPADRLLYLVIYSFHMPLFAFVTGIFARYDPARIRNHMIYPYLVFQTLYLIFANRVLEKDADMQYTTPYWLLWYLLAIIVWNLVLPLVQGEGASIGKKAVMLAAAMAAGILIGFDKKTGYYLSFSRVVEFFPYFLMGVYYRQMKALRLCGKTAAACVRHKKLLRGILTGLVCVFLAGFVYVLYRNVEEIRLAWLYGSVSYDVAVPGIRHGGGGFVDGLFSAGHAGKEAAVSVLHRGEYDDRIPAARLFYQIYE